MFFKIDSKKIDLLSGTPRENRAKKIDGRIFYFFFHFFESSGRKKLITTGKKNKIFHP